MNANTAEKPKSRGSMLKAQLASVVAMSLVAAIALGSATYAWFVNNNAVVAQNIDVSVSASVPNLYIEENGHTTGDAAAAATNPSKLYPTSTNNAINFFETLHWITGGTAGVADKYQTAISRETKQLGDPPSTTNCTVYADYTFTLGVINGTMKVYFDGSDTATTLAAATNMGTAGRFAIKFDKLNGDGEVTEAGSWKMFKVKGTTTGNGYYTDFTSKDAETGDYWVTGAGNAAMVSLATYLDQAQYSGTVSETGTVTPVNATNILTTISSEAVQRVTVRVWYEGCDKDCVSGNAGEGITSAIAGNLGFVGVAA